MVMMTISNILASSLLPSDAKLAFSTLTGTGLSLAMSHLAINEKIHWLFPVAFITNQLWKQAMVSALPVSQKYVAIRCALSPLMFLFTSCVARISGYRLLEWPTSMATALVVSQHALTHFGPLQLVSAFGTSACTLGTLGIYPLLSRIIWNRGHVFQTEPEYRGLCPKRSIFPNPHPVCKRSDEYKEMIDSIVERFTKERDEFVQRRKDKEQADLKRHKEADERIEAKANETYERLMNEYYQTYYLAPPPPVAENCFAVDAAAFADLSDMDRCAHKDLNPLCENHARMILSLGKEIKDCKETGRLAKKLKVTTHPDNKPSYIKELAQKAFIAVEQAFETLCPKPQPLFR